MVEVPVGIEDGNRIGDIFKHPFYSTHPRVYDEVFSLYGHDIAVGLGRAHRLHFDVHVL
jgi:hypothetical protein